MRWNKHRSGVYTCLPWRPDLSSFLVVCTNSGWALHIYDAELLEVECMVFRTLAQCQHLAACYSELQFLVGGQPTWAQTRVHLEIDTSANMTYVQVRADKDSARQVEVQCVLDLDEDGRLLGIEIFQGVKL